MRLVVLWCARMLNTADTGIDDLRLFRFSRKLRSVRASTLLKYLRQFWDQRLIETEKIFDISLQHCAVERVQVQFSFL